MYVRNPSNPLQNDEIFLWNPENIEVLNGNVSAYQQRFRPAQWIVLIGVVFVVLMAVNLENNPLDPTWQDFLTTFNSYVVLGTLLAFLILGLYYGLRWLGLQRFRRHGILIRGKVDSCIVSESRVKSGHIYQIDLIGGFYAPNGNYIRCGGGALLNKSDYDSQMLPQAGDQIAVLYVDDEHFALL